MSSNNSLCLSEDQSIGDQLTDDHSIEDQSTEDNYRRDSFSDRFGTDSEVIDILQYLSLKDRLRLECVSKQFQRTVFYSNSEYLLLPQKGITNNQQYIHLFEKWPKLNKIIFGSSDPMIWEINNKISNDLIELIIKYCNNLTHIRFDLIVGIYSKEQKKFLDKFANQLISLINFGKNIEFKYMDSVENLTSIPIFSSAPNLEELVVESFDLFLNQIQFNRLKSFELILYPKYLDDFQVFIERNAKTLKHLTITCVAFFDVNTQTLLTIIAKAINLVHLAITPIDMITDQSLAYYWNQIAINCKQIKSLRLLLKDNKNMRINGETLSILKQFNRLKRLQLFIESSQMASNLIHDFNNSFRGLTHLTICDTSYNAIALNETLLTNIDINLPKLKYLKINCPFTGNEETGRVLGSLSCLEEIELKIKNEEIIPEIERQLSENCKHIKKVRILDF